MEEQNVADKLLLKVKRNTKNRQEDYPRQHQIIYQSIQQMADFLNTFLNLKPIDSSDRRPIDERILKVY
jgi:hypothetical protein